MHETDRELVEGLRRGDAAAYRELVREYEHRVFTIAFRMLGNRQEAEDVAQDVFVSLIRSIHSFRGESQFSTWLFRVAVNHVKNHVKYLRRRRQQLKVAWDAHEGWEPQAADDGHFPTVGRIDRPDQETSARELAAKALAALGELEEEFREALVLREIEGLSYDQIAEITGVPEGTVKSRIHRARAALHRIVFGTELEEGGEEGP
ncbi:MAG: sigma-70 family RNA polymerase sigma factor [Deltaproteobacteria bacterium]|nr:sigma-70 family RNA polymerase sigma factor [Deltaproteobacteria bacterium]